METQVLSKEVQKVQEKTKVCFKCGEIKPVTDFYKHAQMADGRVNKCKTCNKKDVSKNYRKNIKHYKEYEKKRNEFRWEYKTIQCQKWRKKNPEKYKAHCAVNNAVRGGRLKKQACVICGAEDTHAHHSDYSKPLEITWVCAKHHQQLHPRKVA